MGTVTKTIVVEAPVERVFAIWRNFENLPRFMARIESVRTVASGETHWQMQGPLGGTIEWDTETTHIETNHKIAWRSTGGQIQTHGAVLFKPIGSSATEVTVGLEYQGQGGVLGEAVAKLFANPEDQLEADLIRFKRMAEGGELNTTSRYEMSFNLDDDSEESFDGIPENADAESIAGE